MRDLYLVINVFIAVLLVGLSVAALVRKGYRSNINLLFAAFSGLIATWIISNYISNDINAPKEIALYANYTVLASAIAVVAILMLFIVHLAEAKKLQKIANKSLFFIIFIALMCFSPLMVKNIEVQGDVYAISFGFMIWVYAVGLLLLLGFMSYGLFHGLKNSSGLRRRQLLSITFGLVASLPLIITFAFVIPLLTGIFAFTEFAITPTIILVFSLYYSVVRYKLFDIRMAVVRTGAYVLSLVTLAGFYYVLAYIFSAILFRESTLTGNLVSPASIAIAILLAFIFQPVKRFFDRVTNRIFYKDNYDTSQFISELNKTLTMTVELRELLRSTATEIATTLKADQAFFYVNTLSGHYLTAGTVGYKKIPKDDATVLFDYAYGSGRPIEASMLERDDPIYRLMISHRIELVLPLEHSGQMIGILCLGEHASAGYNARDVNVLEVVSDELVIAIQNALAVDKIKDLNSGLQQRIHDATKELRTSNIQLQKLDKAKDEFISMASHQLRTPLTSVKGYISMVLEGDVGKITPTQKKLLSEAFTSSERMVHLINDFLNVSRLQTGKFLIEKTQVDLDAVVRQELRSLETAAAARGLKIIYKPPGKTLPTLMLDDSKIRQVIMNYVDNAIFYSPEGTEITASLTISGDKIIFKVKDRGMGVPSAEKSQLFTKFYRATNARKQRPDGTGVGLFLAKKVIDAHKGRVLFESTEGKGSTFGFEISQRDNSF